MAKETEAEKKAREAAELKARQDQIVCSLPSTGSMGSGYTVKGTNVWRPGQTFTDANGKKTTVTGAFQTALYDPNEKTIGIIRSTSPEFKTLPDQNAIKAFLVQGKYLPKSDYQTVRWSDADNKAMVDLLKDANAGGLTWQEVVKGIASGGSGGAGTTNTTRSLNLSDSATAQNVARAGARALLGRDPSETEMKYLTTALTKYEKANPSVTTQTQTGDNSYNVSSTGGATMAGRGEVIEQAIKSDDALGVEATNIKFNSYAAGIARLAAGQ
jgi:hypothetical protein